MSTPDPFTTYDAAYVLGALSPRDSAAFEAHLRHCERCAGAVRELADLPGILGHAPRPPRTPEAPSPADAGPPPADAGPPPATLLPALLDRVGGVRRRRRLLLTGTAALTLAACTALLLVLLLPAPGGTDGGGAEPVAMTSLVAYPVEATVSLAEDAGRTRVAMNCRYGSADDEGTQTVEYVLVAITHEGEAHELATWRTLPDHPVSLSVATELPRPAIASLEVRSTSGYPVLRTLLPEQPS